jgi:uncharacterized protein YbjT (DUF2867 family)
MTKGLVTVVGATGTHGSPITMRLLKSGWRVRGVCRNIGNVQAAALRAAGAELVSADLDKPDRVNAAIDGSDVVVSIIASLQNRFNIGQATQGIHVAEAAALADVKHFVYSSVLAPQSGVPSHGSTIAIVERIRELGLPATILRLCFFMENLLTHFPAKVENGAVIVALPFPATARLEMVAVDDIARATEVVLRAPQEFIGRELDIVSDEITVQEMMDIIGKVTGKPVVPVQIPLEGLAHGWPQGIPLVKLLAKGGRNGDAAVLKQLIGTPTDFATWVKTTLAPRLVQQVVPAH